MIRTWAVPSEGGALVAGLAHTAERIARSAIQEELARRVQIQGAAWSWRYPVAAATKTRLVFL